MHNNTILKYFKYSINISKENIFGDNSKVTNKDRLCDVSNHRYTLDDLTWND